MIENPKSYDPFNHTAEHILNQTMVRMFNKGRSFSNHIEKKKSKCDYRFERDLTDEEIQEIESKVNEVINQNLEVKEEFLSYEEADRIYHLGNLPEGDHPTIRIIKVGDYDACPCSGPHVNKTSEIGSFRIVSTSHNDGVLRIRFKVKQGEK